jgi:predicted ester cyclase
MAFPAGIDLRERVTDVWRALDTSCGDEAMERYFAPEYVRHSDEGDATRSEFQLILDGLYEGFPDLRTEVADIVVEGNRSAYRWECVGTHNGVYLGVPATGRPVTAGGITISVFDEDGRRIEDWASWNKVSVLHVLGIIPIS